MTFVLLQVLGVRFNEKPTNEVVEQHPTTRGRAKMAEKQDFGYEQTLVRCFHCRYAVLDPILLIYDILNIKNTITS